VIEARLAVAAVVGAALLAVAGCSSDASAQRTAAPAASSTTGPVTGPVTGPATVSGSPSASSATVVPSPGSTAKPGTRSGSLSQSSFPTPASLGAAWTYSVDAGDAEEGYSGNGTPALARNPTELVRTAVPLGCERPAPMPAPQHALEVDYTVGGTKVVAVRGSFARADEAEQFFSGRERNLRGCAGRSGSAAIGALVAHVSVPAPGTVASDRTPRSDPWREIALLDGSDVVLVAVQGRDPLTPAQTHRLVDQFRSSS